MSLRHLHSAHFLAVVAAVSAFLPTAFPYAETGRWDTSFHTRGDVYKPFAKSMFTNTSVILTVNVQCNGTNADTASLDVDWVLRRTGTIYMTL